MRSNHDPTVMAEGTSTTTNTSASADENSTRLFVGDNIVESPDSNSFRSLLPESPSATTSESQRFYEANACSRVYLVVLCIGLRNVDGTDLIDTNSTPWTTETKASVKPKAKILKDEVRRRALLCDNILPKPRPNAWGVTELMEWLNANPISQLEDVKFLTDEVGRVKRIMFESREQQAREDVVLQTGDWRGNLPFLRLIHCLGEDDIKYSYLHRHDPWSRPMLDARNSESRPPTVYETIADRWNSPTFNPSTTISLCHFDFSSSICLDHSTVAALMPATARRVEDKLTQLRASVTRLIRKWEKSGQGDGGHHTDDESSITNDVENEDSLQFGTLQGRPQYALDSRAAFLQGKPSYLLYFWEFIDEHGLLSTTLQKMNEDVAAVDGAASVPTIAAGARSSKKREAEEAGLVASIREAAKVQLVASNLETTTARELHWESRLEKLHDEKRFLRRQINELAYSNDPHNENRSHCYQEELLDIENEIAGTTAKLSKLQDSP